MPEAIKTPLYDLHLEAGGRMVEFAGYSMPVQYTDGIIKEHLHTRESAGLFDVSHMGQLLISGENAHQALEKLIPIELESLPINAQRYGLLLNERGGILDDLIVTRFSQDSFFIVVNAACKQQDIEHLRAKLPDTIQVEHLNDRALLAIQGPQAHALLQTHVENLDQWVFMHGQQCSLFGIECYVTRSGYTGEDGFEISVADKDADTLARKLLEDERLIPVGLGARDSLRLEAGLCLYGHDMDTDTSPIEAGLLWSISKSRRPGSEKAGGYPGADIVAGHILDGSDKKRVGISIDGRAPAREGSLIIDPQTGAEIGVITSGSFSPCLETPIAMGYVKKSHMKPGTALKISVRKRQIDATVSRLPFVENRYYRGN